MALRCLTGSRLGGVVSCRRSSARLVAALVILSLPAAGCGPEPPAEITPTSANGDRAVPTNTDAAGTTPSADHPPAAPGQVRLEAIDQAGLDARIAELNGQVVLVDFWATWCAPCVEKFPQVVALQERYADAGLHVISICIASPVDERARQKASDFLAAQSGLHEARISAHPRDLDAFEDFDLNQVPHYRLYDRECAEVGRFDGLPEDLEARIRAALDAG